MATGCAKGREEGENECLPKARRVAKEIADILREGDGSVPAQGYMNHGKFLFFFAIILCYQRFTIDHEESAFAKDEAGPRLRIILGCSRSRNAMTPRTFSTSGTLLRLLRDLNYGCMNGWFFVEQFSYRH